MAGGEMGCLLWLAGLRRRGAVFRYLSHDDLFFFSLRAYSLSQNQTCNQIFILFYFILFLWYFHLSSLSFHFPNFLTLILRHRDQNEFTFAYFFFPPFRLLIFMCICLVFSLFFFFFLWLLLLYV